MRPPVAEKKPYDVTVHGDKRIDDYYWLRDRDDGDVLTYLEAENKYTEAVMEGSEKLRNKLYDEFVSRIKETDASVPEKLGEYFYYSRTEKGRQYPIHCRRKNRTDAVEEILLDENVLAAEHGYVNVGAFEVSPNQKLLAYSTDTDGSERHVLRVKNLETGEVYREEIPNTYYGVEWAADNRTLFYCTLDDAMRPHKLFRHDLGTAHDRDELVYGEKDDAFYLELSRTRSRRFITVTLKSNTTSEVRYIESDRPRENLKVIQPRQHEIEYRITHSGDSFYIVTNDKARNFKLVRAPVADPVKKNWQDVIPHREDVKIDGIDAFARHLVVYERENGLKRIRIMDLDGGGTRYVEMPEAVYTFWAADNPEFDTNLLRFNYSSLVTPRTVYDYDMDAGRCKLLKRYEVPGGYDPNLYRVERIYADAADGAKIPISVVCRKDAPANASRPLFLYGYGAYGACVEPYFLPYRLSLLDRGFVFAIAHVRGGGEMGRYWYEQGKLLQKKNTFADFIACAEHLIETKYTSRGNIVICGGSAGGLLVGAVANARPELFRCVVTHVPFVDVVTTMLDESIPLTVTEFEEWGNPEKKQHYEYMVSYSPYDNVRAVDYPHILVTSGLNDPRVQYWEPAKWVAKLREKKTDGNLVLLRMKMGEGHSGASGRYDYLRDIAFEYAFIFRCFDITR